MKKLTVFTIGCLFVLPAFSQTIPKSKIEKAAIKKRGTFAHATNYKKDDTKDSKKEMDKQLAGFQGKKNLYVIRGTNTKVVKGGL